MDFNYHTQKGVLIISVDGDRLDATDAPQFKDRVLTLIEEQKTNAVVFDLSPLQFIDSSGLGSLLSILRYVSSHNGDLKLACLTDTVRQMLHIVRMQRLFEIYPDIGAAVEAFAHAKASCQSNLEMS